MDELLELMNDDSVDPSPAMDQDESDDNEAEEEPSVPAARNRDEPRARAIATSSHSKQRQGQQRQREQRQVQRPNSSIPSSKPQGRTLVEASVDDRLGFRMSNRLVSSNDLTELITDYTYFSPSVLSAMTLKRLNTLLQDPSPIIDAATVAGKTESLVTVGIVFSNSGTRISSKGGAFCVLTIGNMNAGPCLSVFLFGEAYGKYCVSCKPGKVIALMAPRLLPANRGDGKGNNSNNNNNSDKGHAVSFSVYDVGQLKLVANARDFGICKATSNSRVKQSNGTFKSTVVQPCKNWVDKRCSDYCEYHRRAQLQASKGGGKQTVNKFQQIKSVHQQAAQPLVAAAARKRNLIGATTGNKQNRFLSQVPNNRATTKTATKTVGNSSSIGAQGGNIPRNLTKQSKLLGQTPKSSRTTTWKDAVSKQMTKRAAQDAEQSSQVARGASPKGDWVKEATASARKRGPAHMGGRAGFSLSLFTQTKKPCIGTNGSTSKRRPTKINTTGMNFDGSVSVPKPSKLFQQAAASTPMELQTTKRIVTPTNDEASQREKLRQQQAEVALRLKEGDTERTPEATSVHNPYMSRVNQMKNKTLNHKQPKKNRKSEAVDDFLSAMGGGVNEDKVRSAKSQFANEVDADEYAIRRRKLLELEKIEASQESRKKKLNPQNGNKEMKMTKAWFCKTCRQSFSLKPGRCIASNHNVKTTFDIKQSVSTDERRSQLHKKSVEDGGLHLGSGIEWNNRFTN